MQDSDQLQGRPALEVHEVGTRSTQPHAGPRDDGQSSFNVVAEPARHLREQLASIGLLAAEVMAASARVRDQQDLDQSDEEILSRAAILFRTSAAKIRFVRSGGQGAEPQAMVSTGVSNDVVFSDKSPADPEEIARFYDDIAQKLDTLKSHTATQQQAVNLYRFFQTVAERARAAAGSSGHPPASSGTAPY